MSKTLAPIHYGLYKRIVLFENIERLIVEKTSRQAGHQILVERFGQYLPYGKLEDIIDHNNIHGWLQDKINVAEKRQAALVYALMQEDMKTLEVVKSAYYDLGFETGGFFQAQDAISLYMALKEVLLDGMPCDRTTSLLTQNEGLVQWKTEKDVHEGNWQDQGVAVGLYDEFRTAFIKGFIKGVSELYLYKYAPDYKVHEIKRLDF